MRTPKLPNIDQRLILREKPVNRTSIMHQDWLDLLFLHWEFPADEIQKTLPQGLYTDSFDGRAYIGITPFFMKNVHPRFMPNLPGISDFLETNVRTYVYDDNGTPGIWFYSLDANQPLAVELAKEFFFLPYHNANMRANKDRHGEVDYSLQRNSSDKHLSSHFVYKPKGEMNYAEPGTLEFFLIERYVLFAWADETKRLFQGRIHHFPHPLMQAEVSAWDDNLFELDHLVRPDRQPDHMIISKEASVEIFTLERVK